ncbi:MAG: alpha-E domain-containing protein [OM182 bacterium]|nr:MAG: alpha-E domain-containing protein [OM182 bacterium]
MLSRVAENIYWMARYLERTESTARLVRSYNHLIMDIPLGSEPPWTVLVDILNAREEFNSVFRRESEKNVHLLLASRPTSTCSIPYAINRVRENLRVTRDVLPDDTWEKVNQLHLFSLDHAESVASRRNRLLFLEQVIDHCQSIVGLIEGAVQRDHAYRFMRVGQLIERADMTARVVDVGAGDILDREGAFGSIDPLLWGALLESLSGTTAYRRQVGPIIEKDSFVDFVFKTDDFPRSIYFCLSEIRRELNHLPVAGPTLTQIDSTRRRLRRFSSQKRERTMLHRFIDGLLQSFIELDEQLQAHWFKKRPRD